MLSWYIFILYASQVYAFHPDIVDDFTCHKCNSSQYCASGSIFACPQFSTALHLASDILHCICDDGYLRVAADNCTVGTKPHFYQYGVTKHCPYPKETNKNLASHLSDCVCTPGLLTSDNECLQCAFGKYNPLFNQTSCVTCLENSFTNSSAKTHVSDCLCNAGFTGSHESQCVACAAGTFKNIAGDSACVPCAENTFSLNGSTTCTSCPRHSVSAAGSNGPQACSCVAGFAGIEDAFGVMQSCVACKAGFYKNTISNADCVVCPDRTFSNTNQSQQCQNCSAHEVSSEDKTHCLCDIGYYADENNNCVPCESGQYKDAVGPQKCQSCLDEQHVSAVASTSISDCFCNIGFTGNQFECFACEQGYYKDFISSNLHNNCQQCPLNTISDVSSTSLLNCTCIPGHGATASGMACEACLPGYYRVSIASELCDACAVDTYQNSTAQTFCYDCPALSNAPSASDSVHDCVCLSGTVRLPPLDDPTCSTCLAGTYASSNGCKNCSVGSFSYQNGVTECSTCPVHGTSQFPFQSCVCIPGYYCAGMQASESFDQQFTTVASSSMPDLISSDYNTDWQNAVQWIDSNVVSDSNLISECDFAGKTYSEIVSILKQHPCPVQGNDGYDTSGTLSSMLDCIVGIFNVNGVEVLGAFLLFENPSNPSSNGLKFSYYTSSEVATFSSLSCVNQNALPIASSSVISFSWGDESCADCLIRTNNDYSACAICLCSEQCLACAANSYKNTTGTHGCTACQDDAQSPIASIAESACQCNTGFYQNGAHTCLECADGTYSDTLDETSCSLCPFYHITSTVNAPYADISDCELCTFCAADHYVDVECAGSVDTICAPCREHSSTNLGYLEAPNFGNLSCACNAGYEFLEDRYICSECDYGFFKDTIQNAACLPCSANENTTAKASMDVHSCLCNFGYEFESDSCLACAANKYKATLSDTLCLDCPENMNTDGTTAASSCMCSKGFRRLVSEAVLSFSCCDPSVQNSISEGIFAWDSVNGRFLRFKGQDSDHVLTVSRDDWPEYLTKAVPKILWNFVTERFGAFPSQECDQTLSNVPCVVSRSDRCQGSLNEPIGCPAYVMNTYWHRANDSTVVTEKISISYSSVGTGNDVWFPQGWYATCVRDNMINTPANCPQFWANNLISRPQVQKQNLLTTCGVNKDSVCTYQTNQLSNWAHHDWCVFTLSCNELHNVHTLLYRSVNGEYLWVKWDLGQNHLISQFLIQSWYWATGSLDPPNTYAHASAAFDNVDVIIAQTDSGLPPRTANNLIIPLNSAMSDIHNTGLLTYNLTSPVLGRYFWISWRYSEGHENSIIYWHTLNIYALSTASATHTIYGSSPFDSNNELKICTECEPGTFKDQNSNNSCSFCAVDTFQNKSAFSACKACPQNSGTYGQVGSIKCTCDAGFEDTTNSFSCTACKDLFFKSSHTVEKCQRCSTCGSNERIETPCNTTHDTVCEACQPNSVSPQNNSMTYCWCVDGYEFVDNVCQPCAIGTFKSGNSNNSIMCSSCPLGKVTEQNASALCSTCQNTCPEGQFILSECLADTDTKCVDCTVCASGYYANPVCGAHYFSFRNDTNCSVCPANFFCLNNAITSCMENAHSKQQSSLLADCVCNAGYYQRDQLTCTVCGYDFYCNGNAQHTCPEHAITFSEVASNIDDCNCQHGYYRLWDDAKTNFTCHLCEEGDWCFDNKAYNCSDARMSSISGSSSQRSCTCQDGWYNALNDTVCLVCPAGFFCTEGRAFSCNDDTLYIAQNASSAGNLWLQHRWTQNQTGASSVYDCLCVKGRYAVETHKTAPIIHVAEVCTPCQTAYYCTGNNLLTECPSNTTSAASSTQLKDCICDVGFGIDSVNSTACTLCAPNHYKTSTGNTQCSTCASCGVFEFIAAECVATQNRICSNCNACEEGDIYTKYDCTSITDAICANCSQCDYSYEYASPDCSSASNRVCHNITRVCYDDGFYAGQHTQTSDRLCLPCQVTANAYFGMNLHVYTSPGNAYGNPYSCALKCVPGAARANALNASEGCRSCEIGNVLLKRFHLDYVYTTECLFECISPYVRKGDDCIVRAENLDRSQLLHVTEIQYRSDRLWFRLLHSNYAHYIILVGRRPAACTRQNLANIASPGCCFHDLFRISNSEQMGRLDVEQCSMQPMLASARLNDTQTSFEIEDAFISTVANCSNSAGVQTCSLYVSLLDLITSQVVHQHLLIHQRRNYIVSYLNAKFEYIPMQHFSADVQVAFDLETGEKIFRIYWEAFVSQPLVINMRVRGMNIYILSEAEQSLCSRLSVPFNYSNATNFLATPGTRVKSLTYWRGDTEMIQLFLALESTKQEIMDIAVIRNMTSLHAQCVLQSDVIQLASGNIFVSSGLGANVIHGMQLYTSQNIPVTHGKLGNLRTFLAVSATSETVQINLNKILAVHLLEPETYAGNMVEWSQGTPQFVYDFQMWCLYSESCEFEFITRFHNLVYELHNCSLAGKLAAQQWIRAQFSAANDAGHTDAVCNRISQFSSTMTKVYYVHAMRYSHPKIWEAKSTMQAKSYFWANIQFVT